MSYHRVSHSFRICGSSIVGHLGHVAVVVVDVVVDVLDAAVRESHGVGTLGVTCAITGLSSIEVRVGVVVSYSILVGVGGHLVRVDLSSMSNYGGMVGRGSMNYRSSMVDSVDHRSSMVDSVNKRGSMVDSMTKRGSMVDSMCYRGNMVSSMDKRGQHGGQHVLQEQHEPQQHEEQHGNLLGQLLVRDVRLHQTEQYRKQNHGRPQRRWRSRRPWTDCCS